MTKKSSLLSALALAAAVTLTGCGAGAQSAVPAAPVSNAPAPSMAGHDASGMAGHDASGMAGHDASGMAGHQAGSMKMMIHIEKGKFLNAQPVLAGSSVTVMNLDSTSQQVISDDSKSFKLSVPAGATASFTAPKTPGTYPFHGDKAGMEGVLTVMASEPSAAASMVCADEAKQTVKDVLGLATIPETADKFDGTTFSCTYPLAQGNFIMTVTETPSDADATALAKKMADELQAPRIEGLENLGLPGYQSPKGDVVFAKDNMTLHVDATSLPGALGPHKVKATDFAYQLATTILGCWTKHHS